MSEKRKMCDREFRDGVVRIVEGAGKPIAAVARDLGVNAGILGNWVNCARAERGGEDEAGGESAAELKRLRAEVAELRMELDVLKRSVAGWVKGGDEVMLARFLAEQRTTYRVPHTVTCALLGVSMAWFYKWFKRSQTPGATARIAHRSGLSS